MGLPSHRLWASAGISVIACVACHTPPSGVFTDATPPPPVIDASMDEDTWGVVEPIPEAFDFPPWVTLPAPDTVVISWRSVLPSTGGVRFGTTPELSGLAPSIGEGMLHHVRLQGLARATTYYYQVEIDDTDARIAGQFTMPGRDEVRFVHMGEHHAASDSPQVAKFADQIRKFRPHFIVESGDMTNSGDNLGDWRGYMRGSAPWISNVILLPIGSNHVQGPGGNANFLDLFELPHNERWYRTRFGPVEVLSLDSTFAPQNPDIAAEEPAWVGEQTAKAHDGVDDPSFLIGAWHYPACSSHYKSRASLRNWVMDNFISQFKANGGVDLVLVGHDKYYERSTIGGIMHVQTAAGRLSPSTEGDNHADCSPQVTRTDLRSILLVRADDTSLIGTVVGQDGGFIDAFWLSR